MGWAGLKLGGFTEMMYVAYKPIMKQICAQFGGKAELGMAKAKGVSLEGEKGRWDGLGRAQIRGGFTEMTSVAYKPIMKQICAQFGGKAELRMAKAKAVSLEGEKGRRDGLGRAQIRGGFTEMTSVAYKPIMKQICAQFGGKAELRMAKAKAVSLEGEKGRRDGLGRAQIRGGFTEMTSVAYKPIMKQICAQFGGKAELRMAKAKAVSLEGEKGRWDGLGRAQIRSGFTEVTSVAYKPIMKQICAEFGGKAELRMAKAKAVSLEGEKGRWDGLGRAQIRSGFTEVTSVAYKPIMKQICAEFGGKAELRMAKAKAVSLEGEKGRWDGLGRFKLEVVLQRWHLWHMWPSTTKEHWGPQRSCNAYY